MPPLDDNIINQTVGEYRWSDPDCLVTVRRARERFDDLACEAMDDKVIHSAVGTRYGFGG